MTRRTQRNPRYWVVLCAIVAFLAGACGAGTDAPNADVGTGDANGAATEGSAEGDETLRVVALLDQTGPAGFAGVRMREGIEAAVEAAREEGLLDGFEVEVDYFDSETNVDRGVELAGRVIPENYDAMIGPLNASIALAVTPMTQEAQLPTVLMTADAAEANDLGDYIFKATPPQHTYIERSVEHLVERGVESVAIAYDEANPSLVDLGTELLPTLFDEHGIAVEYQASFKTEDSDFSAIVTSINEANVDAIALMGFGGAVITFINQARGQGFDGIIVGQYLSGLLTDVPAANGTVWASFYNPELDNPVLNTFLETHSKMFSSEPNQFNATAFDAFWMVASAVEATGNASRTGVHEGLQQVTDEGFEGAQGNVTFDGRTANVEGVVYEVRDGQEGPYPVETEEE